jgi:hypothetical protein
MSIGVRYTAWQLNPGLGVSDRDQLLDAVALGQAVAGVPVSVALRHNCAESACVLVSDLSPNQVVVAWPEQFRPRAVASSVRVAAETAAGGTAPVLASMPDGVYCHGRAMRGGICRLWRIFGQLEGFKQAAGIVG